MGKYKFIAAAAALLSAAVCMAQGPCTLDADTLARRIGSSQVRRIEAGEFYGSQVIVYQYGKQVLDSVYGTVSETGPALCGDELYRIASMTKPLTALALLIEHGRGHLDIYDDLSAYLPEFAGRNIKLFQLVSHLSGVGEVDMDSTGMKSCTLEKAVQYLSSSPSVFEAGTRQQYSTGAFDLAAMVVSKVSGMEFGEYLRRNIFRKLGMKDTTFEPSGRQWGRMVEMHARDAEGRSCPSDIQEGCVFGNFPVGYHAAGAALASTAQDYAAFALMLAAHGKSRSGRRVTDPQTLALMSTPFVDDSIMAGSQKWGLGVRVITGENTLPEGAFGWSGAYGTHFWIDPVNDIVVVYMKNSTFDGGAGATTARELEQDVMSSLMKK